MVQRVGVGDLGRLSGSAFSCSVGVEQQLLDDQARDLVDARAGSGGRPASLRLEPLELGPADRLEALAQRDDGRHRAARPLPGVNALDLLVDDRFGARDLGAAPREVLADDRLQVVDVVEEHLLDFADRRLDVARHRDVDEEQRPRRGAPAPPATCARDEDRRGAPVAVMTMSASRSAAASSSHGTARAADLAPPAPPRGPACGW